MLTSVPVLTIDYYDPNLSKKRERRALIYLCETHIGENTRNLIQIYHK